MLIPPSVSCPILATQWQENQCGPVRAKPCHYCWILLQQINCTVCGGGKREESQYRCNSVSTKHRQTSSVRGFPWTCWRSPASCAHCPLHSQPPPPPDTGTVSRGHYVLWLPGGFLSCCPWGYMFLAPKGVPEHDLLSTIWENSSIQGRGKCKQMWWYLYGFHARSKGLKYSDFFKLDTKPERWFRS